MNDIDLTMLARAAYKAILKSVEGGEDNENTQTPPDMARQSALPGAGRPDRSPAHPTALA